MASQRERDEMITKLVDAVPILQTDVALVKRDIHYLTTQGERQETKLDAFAQKQDTIIERLDKMTVVTPDQFNAYQQAINNRFQTVDDKNDKRFKLVENFLQDNKPGISLSNALVSKWITLLVLLLTAGALIIGFAKVVPLGQ